MIKISRFSALLLGTGLCLVLSACQTTQSPESQQRGQTIDDAVNRSQATSVNAIKSLAEAERDYKKNPQDETAAKDYAHALREKGSLDQAALILEPFVSGKKSAQSSTLAEFSSILLAMGDSVKAEQYAQKAVLADEMNYKAYHNLGLSLETQGKHEEAERAFRKGLDLWQGDPTTIMNNLALNLSAQGYLDEAVEILRRAQTLAPEKKEIERNLRIVTALQQAARGPTPMPEKKPAT